MCRLQRRISTIASKNWGKISESENDLSDIVGILWEHQKSGTPISREAIDAAIATLYGVDAELPPVSTKTLDDCFAGVDFGLAYHEIREREEQAKDVLLDFDKAYPGKLKGDTIEAVLEKARMKNQR